MTNNGKAHLASCELENVHGGANRLADRFETGFDAGKQAFYKRRLWTGRPHGVIETTGWAAASALMPFAF
jgi:hypothetical protein